MQKHDFTPETREKLRQRTRELWKNPEYRARVIAKRAEFWKDNDAGREIIRKEFEAKRNAPGFYDKMRAGIARYWTPERRAAAGKVIGERNRARLCDEDTRRAQSERLRETWKRLGGKEMGRRIAASWTEERLAAHREKMATMPRDERGRYKKGKVENV